MGGPLPLTSSVTPSAETAPPGEPASAPCAPLLSCAALPLALPLAALLAAAAAGAVARAAGASLGRRAVEALPSLCSSASTT